MAKNNDLYNGVAITVSSIIITTDVTVLTGKGDA